MPRFLLFMVCTALLFMQSLFSIAQPAKAEDSIAAILQQHEVMGLAVAVVKKGKLVYTHSFGWKNKELNQPLQDDNLFRIASISKSFSATAIMQLVEAKKISLDDDISKLVGFTVRHPKFPNTVITLRMILSHRSAINDSQGYFTLDAINPAKNINWQKCYSEYEPGTGYRYCNLNYNMAGTIIEKISGERFDRYIQKHILEPLDLYGGYWVDGLDSTKFTTIYEYSDSLKKLVGQPMAYAPRRDEINNYVMGYSTPIFSPTGGMKISAPDLARYMIMHMNKGKANGRRVIKKKSAITMQTPLSEKEGYGLAISTTEKLITGKTLKGHTGSAYGLFSAMFFDPKEKWGIVVINSGSKPGYTDGYHTVIRKTVNALYEFMIKEKE
jgi:CubicO group peptidase (beta-lactamase class C family)